MKSGRPGQKGFTLVELAIVLIISSLVMSAFVRGYTLYNKGRTKEATFAAMDVSRSALSEYRKRTGHYPCPARLDVALQTAGSGVEDCAGVNSVTVAGRDEDGDGNDDTILIGAVPYATMEPVLQDIVLIAGQTVDGWNNHLVYAVSANLADPAKNFNDNWGVISVEDENGNSVINPPDRAQMIVFSHGANGRGAYTSQGGQVEACNLTPLVPPYPPGMTALREIENCDNDSTFLSGLINETEYSYNDDYLRFIVVQNTGFWTYTGSIPGTTLKQVANTNPGNVGFGVENPETRLHIDGRITANEIQSVEVCDQGGANCFGPELLGGNNLGMNCDDNDPRAVVTSIQNGQVTCGTVVSTLPAVTTTCPAGWFMIGITNLNNVVCCDPANIGACPYNP